MPFSPTLAAYFHTLSPFIFEFSSGVGLRWYGTAYAAGLLVGWAILRWLSARRVTPLSPTQITDAMLVWCMGVVFGGRFGYIFFYDPNLLIDFSSSPPFWGVLALNRGGMSSHGGMIGVLVACWWIARKFNASATDVSARVPMLHVMDLSALACTPGLFFGRIANFINGELLGDIAAAPGAPAPWYTVKFPQERFSGHEPPFTLAQQQAFDSLIARFRIGDEFADQTYERILRTVHSQPAKPGTQAHDIIQTLEPLIAARYPSQLLQGAFEGLLLGGILLLMWRTPRRAGIIVAVFLAFYGVTRIFTELVRLPDANLAVQRIAGLTRGQLLSVVMLLGATASIILARKLNWVGPGWGRSRPTPPTPPTSPTSPTPLST